MKPRNRVLSITSLTSSLVVVLGQEGPQPLNLPRPSARSACYYMSQQDFDEAVAHFTEVAQYFSRDLWLSWNGYPCDLDIQSPIPRENCVECTEAIFDLAGW